MKSGEKHRIAGDTLTYTASVYAAQLLGMIGGIATRRYLEPTEMGVWVLLQTFLSYALLAECGILTSMYCLLPKLDAQGNEAERAATRDTAFSFALVSAFAAAAVFVALALAGVPDGTNAARLGLLALAGGVIATVAYNFQVSYLWATNGFGPLARAVLLNAGLQFAAVFTLVRMWGLRGLLLSMPLVPLLTLLYAAHRSGAVPRFRFDLRRAASLIAFGAPVFMTGLVYTFFISLDRLLVVRTLGTEVLGHYSLALVAFSFSSVAPKMFSIVLFPRIQSEVAAGSPRAVSMVVKPDLAVAFLSPPLLAAAYFFLPVLTDSLLPKYTEGLPAARTLLVGSFFLALVYNSQSFLVALDKRAHPIPFLAAGALTAAAGAAFLSGYGVTGIAAAMGAAFFVVFASMSAYALGRALPGRAVAAHLAEITAVFVYFAALAFFAGRLAPGGTLLNFFVQSAVFAVAYAPVLFWAERRTGVLSLGAEVIGRKFIRRVA